MIMVLSCSSSVSSVNTSCVRLFFSVDHSDGQGFLSLLNVPYLKSFCTALTFKSSQVVIFVVLVVMLGLVSAFWLLSRIPSCMVIHFSGWFHQILSVETYRSVYSCSESIIICAFEPVLFDFAKPSIVFEEGLLWRLEILAIFFLFVDLVF